MLIIVSARADYYVAIHVLKQMVWLRQELANVEESGLELAELTSIRDAILESLAELSMLYETLDLEMIYS